MNEEIDNLLHKAMANNAKEALGGWPLVTNWSSGPFTMQDLENAMKKVEEAEFKVCTHVVHSMATGPTPCAGMCGAIIDIGDVPLSQRGL